MKLIILSDFYMLFFFITSTFFLQNSLYHELMHVNVSLLLYVSDHFFLHDLQLFFKINYEIIFSYFKHLAKSFFEAKLRFKQ